MRSWAVAATLIVAGVWPAAASTGGWQTDPRSGCTVWDPQPVPDETIAWTGACTDGKASGRGVLTIFRAGRLVERNDGEFVDGKQTGQGRRDYPKGHYVGTFKEGLFDGRGVYDGVDGMRYDGEFRDGNFEGSGKLSFSSGVRYEGQFGVNTFNGFGSLTLPDGARYDGEYVLNTPHGTGVYRSANGTIYAGQWIHGCFRQGNRTAHLAVPPEDCGLSEDSTPALAAAPQQRDSQEN